MLQQAKVLSCDGTFSTCPPPFCQLFVVMSQLNASVNIPVAFGLLPNKFTRTYIKFWTELSSMAEDMFTSELNLTELPIVLMKKNVNNFIQQKFKF